MSIHNSDVFFAMPELKTLHALTVLDGGQRVGALNIRPECYEYEAAAEAWLQRVVKDLEALEAAAHPAYLEYGKRAYRKLRDLWSVMTGKDIDECPYPGMMNKNDSPSFDDVKIDDCRKLTSSLNYVVVSVLWSLKTGRIKTISVGYEISDLTLYPKYYDEHHTGNVLLLKEPHQGTRIHNHPITLYPKNADQEYRYTLTYSPYLQDGLECLKKVIADRLKGSWSEDELREQFLEQIATMVIHQSGGKEDNVELLGDFAFSMLSFLDNGTLDIPGYCLIPNADDPEHRHDLELAGVRPYPKDIPDIAGGLHEQWFPVLKDRLRGVKSK